MQTTNKEDRPRQEGAIIRCATEAGINVFDTADVYSRGVSEEMLGEQEAA